MILTTTYCAALCINLFFGWPEEKKWNLGEWVDSNVVMHTPHFMNAYVYSNEKDNVTVRVSKSKTINGCASYRIKVTKVNNKKPSAMMPGTLGIREFCAE